MSRCFPYPPPGYSSSNRDRNEALIDSIKLQRESEKVKAEQKKERKREKKEKRRENKANVKPNVSELGHGEKIKRNDEKTRKSEPNVSELGCGEKIKRNDEKTRKSEPNVSELGRGKKRKHSDEKTRKSEKHRVDLKGRIIQNGREQEAEQLEKSGLTEEHEQPTCPQNPSYSSESIQNSNKRRRQASPVSGIHTNGNVIRIRLPSLKHKESDVPLSEERLQTTTGRTESTGKHNPEIFRGQSQEVFCLTSVENDKIRLPSQKLKESDVAVSEERIRTTSRRMKSTGKHNSKILLGPSHKEFCSNSTKNDASVGALSSRPDKEQSSSTSGGIGIFGQDNLQATPVPTSFEKGIHTVASLYKDLVENWVPLPPQLLQGEQTDLDELEWLFQRKHQDQERSTEVNSDASCRGGSTLWPHALYMPEADIWALPFTVPF
ncbi:hypothetical protein LOK49_LG05G03796 [Camellia lanceoleosa]|uniref:Uncharacterized protein n=1 Tax=Camellia lanceoleosa TaxID=1840588 RepID=A0ACC0HUF8_9ERIC|nr:hypothetical protein LOK49_LG05G03796 [Camellia lanceoleosa]